MSNWMKAGTMSQFPKSVGVRYGSVGGLAFTIGYGTWCGTLGRHETPSIS
ncbi:hypothetical protein [Streptomyces sp. NPDC006309]